MKIVYILPSLEPSGGAERVITEKANYFATKTLRKVQKKVGFPERIR